MANPTRGADLLIQTLANAGVKTIFALSGNQIMSVFDACIDFDIDIIHTRHEGAAVYMAEAYAQLTGSLGVALVTAGAGVGNAAGALFSASESDTPVLLISGDSPVELDGKGAFQEMDQVAITSAVTRWSHRITSVSDLPATLQSAFTRAQTPHPGPVHLALPVDILKQSASDDLCDVTLQRQAAAAADIDKIVGAINVAQRPVIITGPSMNSTRQPALYCKLSENCQAPVVCMESPRGLNDPAAGNVKSVLKEADLIVSLGKRIDFSVGFANGLPAAWHVVVASQSLAKQASGNLQRQLQHQIIADPIAVADQMVQVSQAANYAETDARTHWVARVKQAVIQRPPQQSTCVPGDSAERLTPAALCAEVQNAITRCNNAILVCDGGEFGQWAQACLTAPTRVINGLSGSIGGGIGYGIGAAKAHPGATVFVMTGDGSVGFHLAELETAVRNQLSIVVVVGNDHCWNAEHQLQMREFGAERLYRCELSQISYHDTCVALGGCGRHVKTAAQLRSALSEELAVGVTCIDVNMTGLAAPTF